MKSAFMSILKKISDKLAAYSKSRDPSEFNDDIAMRTSWEPFNKTTSNFNTHTLKDVADYTGKLAYKPSGSFYFMSGLFMLIGGSVAVFSMADSVQNGKPLAETLALSGFGLLFFGIGFGLFKFMTRRTVFDPTTRSMECRGNRTYYSDIYAIQLVRQRGNKYSNAQINLIMHNAERVHVMNYADSKTARLDAARIAEAMGVPQNRIWDAMPNYTASQIADIVSGADSR